MGIFGPSKKQAWYEFAQAKGARFVDDGFFKGVRVEIDYKVSTIYLDTYTVSTGKSSQTYTRMRALYVGSDDFSFKINRRTIFTDIAKAFGRKYVPTGDAVFDQAFAIRSNDEGTAKKLFSGEKLRQKLLDVKKVSIAVKGSEGKFGPEYQPRGKELYYYTGGVIKDHQRLADLFDMYKLLLDSLLNSNIAVDERSSAQLFARRKQ